MEVKRQQRDMPVIDTVCQEPSLEPGSHGYVTAGGFRCHINGYLMLHRHRTHLHRSYCRLMLEIETMGIRAKSIHALCLPFAALMLLAGCQTAKKQDVGNTSTPDFYTSRGPSGR